MPSESYNQRINKLYDLYPNSFKKFAHATSHSAVGLEVLFCLFYDFLTVGNINFSSRCENEVLIYEVPSSEKVNKDEPNVELKPTLLLECFEKLCSNASGSLFFTDNFGLPSFYEYTKPSIFTKEIQFRKNEGSKKKLEPILSCHYTGCNFVSEYHIHLAHLASVHGEHRGFGVTSLRHLEERCIFDNSHSLKKHFASHPKLQRRNRASATAENKRSAISSLFECYGRYLNQQNYFSEQNIVKESRLELSQKKTIEKSIINKCLDIKNVYKQLARVFKKLGYSTKRETVKVNVQIRQLKNTPEKKLYIKGKKTKTNFTLINNLFKLAVHELFEKKSHTFTQLVESGVLSQQLCSLKQSSSNFEDLLSQATNFPIMYEFEPTSGELHLVNNQTSFAQPLVTQTQTLGEFYEQFDDEQRLFNSANTPTTTTADANCSKLQAAPELAYIEQSWLNCENTKSYVPGNANAQTSAKNNTYTGYNKNVLPKMFSHQQQQPSTFRESFDPPESSTQDLDCFETAQNFLPKTCTGSNTVTCANKFSQLSNVTQSSLKQFPVEVTQSQRLQPSLKIRSNDGQSQHKQFVFLHEQKSSYNSDCRKNKPENQSNQNTLITQFNNNSRHIHETQGQRKQQHKEAIEYQQSLECGHEQRLPRHELKISADRCKRVVPPYLKSNHRSHNVSPKVCQHTVDHSWHDEVGHQSCRCGLVIKTEPICCKERECFSLKSHTNNNDVFVENIRANERYTSTCGCKLYPDASVYNVACSIHSVNCLKSETFCSNNKLFHERMPALTDEKCKLQQNCTPCVLSSNRGRCNSCCFKCCLCLKTCRC